MQDCRDELARMAKALGHPHRVQIVRILAEQPADAPCMVGGLVEQLPICQSTVSQHLKVLKEAGWIEGAVEGPRVCYCLRPDVFTRFVWLVRELQPDGSRPVP